MWQADCLCSWELKKVQTTCQKFKIPYAVISSDTGDINGDGTVDILDVIVVNKHLLGCKELDELQTKAADVDGNGIVESTDSLNILKYALKIIKRF